MLKEKQHLKSFTRVLDSVMAKLKLAYSASKPVKRERNIVGIVHRCSQRSEDRTRNLTRRYSSVASAFMRMTQFMVMNGYVGDVAEIAHHTSGMQLGTIKMTATGRLKTDFNLKGD